ncbi:hypothetical protein NDU88_003070 [Pleurodeles waltl]|uniref:DDE Tnp4 domain-containing protein n=1 Tax=Pleurodeles waltl TaxID=8319 RepID=A0AAV7W136_PLEWA|nr:hypothetical protein NDU88_003070 [Pleurodeles waltl]
MGTPSSLGGQPQLGLCRLPCPVAQVLPPFAAVGALPVKDPQGPHLLGDGKPITLFMMGADLLKKYSRKVRNARTRAEERYSEAHGQTRRIIERTFGLLKAMIPMPPSDRWIPILLTQEGVPDHRCMLHNLALRRQVQFLQEDEPGDGHVAALELVDSDEEEAEEEDVDNRSTLIQQYFQ